MIHHVVRAPHPRVGGHGDEDFTAGREPVAHRPERPDVVLDVLDDVQHGDQIVAGRDARQLGKRRIAYRLAQALAGDRAGGRIDLNRVHRAEAGQHREVVPGAAADLQDARRHRQPRFARQIISQNVAPRAVPPMRAVVGSHAVVDDAVHIRRTPSCAAPRR